VATGAEPSALCYNPQGDKVCCANFSGHSVTVIDGASNQVIATVATGAEPSALCYNPADNKVYCVNLARDSVAIIGGASNQVITTVAVGSQPGALCYNPRDDKVYCVNNGTGGTSDVTVIGGASDSVVKTITVGLYPCALTCNPARDRVYVANFYSASVSIIGDSAAGGIQERAPLVGRCLSLEAEPNPFSGQTRLRFVVSGGTVPNRSGSGHAPGVRVYDVNGTLVRNLNSTRSLAPLHACSLVWDGTDGSGRRLQAGVYVVRLTDGANSVNRKVMLLR
jgi:YVTN family beta-propeller protein